MKRDVQAYNNANYVYNFHAVERQIGESDRLDIVWFSEWLSCPYTDKSTDMEYPTQMMVLGQDSWTEIILNPQETSTGPEIIVNTLRPKHFVDDMMEYMLLYWLIFILLKFLFELILKCWLTVSLQWSEWEHIY